VTEQLFSSVRDARLHEEVARQIARRIILGDFPVGATLPAESELIGRFGVSRAVIREALRSLEASGMIVVRHGRRTVVTPREEWDVLDRLVLAIHRDEGLIGPLMHDSLHVRRMLEPAIAAEAAERATPELLGALAACLERQAALLDQPDAFLEEDITFHNLLAGATGNRVLMRVMVVIRDLLHVSREVTNRLPNTIPGALASHRRIYEAVQDGDAARAAQAMTDHLERMPTRIWQGATSEEQQAGEQVIAASAS
jgi:DNA-binding FadR family transcriptional regulator